jgi:response regulator RpfG family c-di-GMP phosphodiesterase
LPKQPTIKPEDAVAGAARLLVVHDGEGDGNSLVEQLRALRYEVDVADGVGPACFMLRRTDYTTVIADLPAADSGALAVLRAASRSHPAARVILTLPAVASAAEPALPELSRAAYRCLRQPVGLEDELLPVVREAIADHRSEFERPIHGFRPRVRTSKAPVEETVDGVIRAMQLALEFHDHSAERRPRRVVAMASEIARACGISDEDVDMEDIYYAAALSDIGKIGVPSTVLAKQQLLNEADWAELRRHPEHAWRILREIPQLRGAADLLFAAHEQWDGQGYPRGLAQERIPAGSRVVSLAVAWDAMTSARAHRRAMSHEEARLEIVAASGTLFDPTVVAAFERVVDTWNPELSTIAHAA